MGDAGDAGPDAYSLAGAGRCRRVDVDAGAWCGRMEGDLAAYRLAFAQAAGAAWGDSPGLAWTRTGLRVPFLNSVPRFRVPDEEADAAIAGLAERLAGVPSEWLVTPSSRPLDLADRLARHGWRHAMDHAGMALDPARLRPADRPAGATLARVADEETLAHAAAVTRAAFDAPPHVLSLFPEAHRPVCFGLPGRLALFLARVDGEPAAVGALHLLGGTAGLHGVATLPGMQRRGLGGWVTTELVREAARRGASLVTLEATPVGEPLYARLGFRPCGTVRVFQRRPA